MSPPRPSNTPSALGAALCCVALASLCISCRKAPEPNAPPPPSATSATSPAGFGPQTPPNDAVLPKLRPCMEVGRVFARMPPEDRLEAVVDACAPILRPPCAAALRAQLDIHPDAQIDAGTAAGADTPPAALSPTAQLIAACADAYCPDLQATSAPPPLCAPSAGASPPVHRSGAQITFLTAALTLDFPEQAQGLDLLAGILISALPIPKPSTDPPTEPTPSLD